MREKILIVDDDEKICQALSIILNERGYLVTTAKNGQEALDKPIGEFSLIITDMKMPRMSGLEFLQRVKKISPDIVVIILTAFGSIETAVEAIKQGAYDYITKPFELNELTMVVSNALHLHKEIEKEARFDEIVGNGERIKEVHELINLVAKTDATVLITGETGTGKELVARAIHRRSLRMNMPFIAINCVALPEELLESELFGHEKGAFTGAVSSRLGRFELGSTGTIFLDEIGEIGIPIQVKLLRVLQERAFERVGGNKTINVDVRIVAATSRDLEKAVKDGIYREELYYRLNVVPIFLPPLRERKEDIPLLLEHFLNIFNHRINKNIIEITKDAQELLVGYDWHGNIRELENVVERMVILAKKEKIGVDDVPQNIIKIQRKGLSFKETVSQARAGVERQALLEVLQGVDGHRTKAAKALGIDRKTLQKKIKEYGIEVGVRKVQ
ncbi:MAG: sigma-54 dependent transcriptional regulator [Candidatus Desantisbacteria bacterium]